ncbi:M20 family metallopeptidase [Nesterenkonia xinjiangensis]|uniref:Peptidase M20 domain-containing protein 2 n=2 Tax=Nesterenkonia xinjiangensis TaxID=225327 RepID=A0A7Z0KBS3_9MICC|nr:M20 family metallopeptidase [Nesterenkonia xinjiangensis]NYJ77917.1 amidohydrolase [Nesterenkonia xinjiangensis]
MSAGERLHQISEDELPAARRQTARAVNAIGKELVGLSHGLHAAPEIRWQEFRSAERISEMLRELGFQIEMPFGKLDTAFRARLGTGSRHVGFIAEYDALEGIGHACGHNIIAAAAVGAAAALRDLAGELDATVEVIGTPAEEGGGGKIHLIEDGAFDHLEAALMVHPGPANSLYARPFAVAHFDVVYTGFAAHAAAYPHLGTNAADAMTVAQVAIGLLRQQLPASTRVHGIVREAGSAPNVIPDHCRGSWYVRAADLDELEATFERVRGCFEAGALAAGASMEVVETSPRYSEFRNDAELADLFAVNAQTVGRDMDREESVGGGMNTASTDMGNVSLVTRAIHPYLSIDSLPAVNHQKEFAQAAVSPAADRAVIEGAYLLAATVEDFLRS